MVLQPLLDRLVSYYEPKSLGDSGASCLLHIEVPEWDRVRHGLGSTVLARNEVELIVNAPVVFNRVYRAVPEDELRVAG
jgi:hypothetical protein